MSWSMSQSQRWPKWHRIEVCGAEEVIVYRVYGYRVCCAEWREVESGVSRSVQAPVDLAAE